jgi:DNA-binding transcriptional LysR family regulator
MAVFKRAVDAGSFAAAARQFDISPEMAGNHVRALETQLGVRLLNRTTRRLQLTEAGRNYYVRCSQILVDVEEADAEASSHQIAPRGLLRITAPLTFGVLHLSPVISDYVNCYPQVAVDVSLTDRYVNLIEAGLDLAIRIGGPPDSTLIARRLASAHLILCAAPAYLERAGRPEKPADLARHACLVYADTGTPRTWRFTAADGHTETVQITAPITSDNPQLLVSFAIAGHGLIFWPSFGVDADILAGRLVPLLTNWRSRVLTLQVVYPHRPLLPANVRSFVGFLASRFKAMPELDRWGTASRGRPARSQMGDPHEKSGDPHEKQEAVAARVTGG